jgi:hypothetical protein
MDGMMACRQRPKLRKTNLCHMEAKEKGTSHRMNHRLWQFVNMSIRSHMHVPFTKHISYICSHRVELQEYGFSSAGTILVLRVFRQPHSKMVIYATTFAASQSLWGLLFRHCD